MQEWGKCLEDLLRKAVINLYSFNSNFRNLLLDWGGKERGLNLPLKISCSLQKSFKALQTLLIKRQNKIWTKKLTYLTVWKTQTKKVYTKKRYILRNSWTSNKNQINNLKPNFKVRWVLSERRMKWLNKWWNKCSILGRTPVKTWTTFYKNFKNGKFSIIRA